MSGKAGDMREFRCEATLLHAGMALGAGSRWMLLIRRGRKGGGRGERFEDPLYRFRPESSADVGLAGCQEIARLYFQRFLGFVREQSRSMARSCCRS